ncbi:MAG: ABC transporter ATP-binding protein [Agathobacter sp.]
MISCKGVHKAFRGKIVLDEINLTVSRGEIFGLLGPSGAGKTTLIKILTGQLAYDGGQVSVLGKDASALTGEDHNEMGIMMDQFGVYDRFSCMDNLKIFSDIYGISYAQAQKALCDVGLLDAKKTAAAKLSKGMRTRLCLARVFMTEPKLMFLDEPTSALDPATTASIHELILRKREEGCTIFLTTHNMEEAAKLCTHVALLNEGRIVEYGNPSEICRKYDHQRSIRVHLYDGKEEVFDYSDTSADQIQALIKNGRLQTIHSTEPNLESVFMELTGRRID